ncbi:MAG: class I SAM-dependent methyltransferase [SAR202 cluster bacterium]|nr:MAG: class I SAM-dependent methyltransferase [SAR202 cluster bacterium]
MTNYDNWAEIYDELYSEYKDDLSFYQEISSSAKSILEIGCAITGIDISSKMIEIATGKIKKPLPNLSFKVMDMTELNLNQQFDLIIIPFNGFQSLLNEFDQLKCLKKIKSLCHKKTKIILDVFFPDKEIYEQKNTVFYQVSQKTQKSLEVSHMTKFDYFNQLLHTNLKINKILNNQNSKVSYKSFTLRYCYKSVTNHLHYDIVILKS